MWGQYIKNYGGYGMQSVDSSNLPNVPFIPALGQSQLNFQGYKDGMNIARKLASQQPSTPLGFKYDYMQLMWNRHSYQGDFSDYENGFNKGLLKVQCKIESLSSYKSRECSNFQD